MTDYTKMVEALNRLWQVQDNDLEDWVYGSQQAMHDAADAIEALQAEVKRLQNKLCDWCAVCPKERRKPEDCELLGENPVMYVPSGARMEVQDG